MIIRPFSNKAGWLHFYSQPFTFYYLLVVSSVSCLSSSAFSSSLMFATASASERLSVTATVLWLVVDTR